mmetsp:Transcript_4872/g.7377  ORF Transcript_4872/g.7377 Transcript_4872/m.7377 type:complete len:210 (-) Transcript_4872:69-698(-)
MHDITHSFTSIIHCSTLTRQLCCPHPVTRTFYIFKCRDLCKYQVRKCLSNRSTSHCLWTNKTLDWLFANCSSHSGIFVGFRTRKVRLRDHTNICKRCLQWAHTWLLCNKTGHRSIDLCGQETLGTYLKKAHHAVKRIRCIFSLHLEWHQLVVLVIRGKRFLWHLTQNVAKRKVDRDRAILFVMYFYNPISSDRSNEPKREVFTSTNLSE